MIAYAWGGFVRDVYRQKKTVSVIDTVLLCCSVLWISTKLFSTFSRSFSSFFCGSNLSSSLGGSGDKTKEEKEADARRTLGK